VLVLFVRRNFFYLAALCFLFLFLAVNYERSDSTLKRMEQDVVAATTKTGVYQGNLAKKFQLLNQNGETVSLSDYRGKKVILNFFATWCAPCQEEMTTLVELDKTLNKENIVLIGINVTKEEPNPNVVRDFIKHYQVQYDVLFDGEGTVMKDYQLIGIPTTILIDEKGKVVRRLNGMVTMDMIKNDPFFEEKIK
jgi:peroxiredoxin